MIQKDENQNLSDISKEKPREGDLAPTIDY